MEISKDISLAKKILEEGNLVAIPTETVYGLAGNAFNLKAVNQIFELKKRPKNNPLILHLATPEHLSMVAEEIPDCAYELAHKFWPGPLTLILKKKSIVNNLVTSGNESVAVRIPDHKLTRELLNTLDYPLAAPSANPFGSISPTSPEHVRNYFKDQLKMILDGGNCSRGIESTILGFEKNQPILYRLGALSTEAIESVTGTLKLKTKNDSTPEAPGMLSKHYAPKTSMILTDLIEKEILNNHNKKLGIITFNDDSFRGTHYVEVLSAKGNLEEAATNLYAALHRMDTLNLDLIIAKKLPNTGLGRAINDRLSRAVKK